MSCGNHHETPCTEVLSLMYVYIDNEIDEVQRVQVTTHLTECPPCTETFQYEEVIKLRVSKSCGGAQAPDTLRASVTAEIRRLWFRQES